MGCNLVCIHLQGTHSVGTWFELRNRFSRVYRCLFRTLVSVSVLMCECGFVCVCDYMWSCVCVCICLRLCECVHTLFSTKTNIKAKCFCHIWPYQKIRWFYATLAYNIWAESLQLIKLFWSDVFFLLEDAQGAKWPISVEQRLWSLLHSCPLFLPACRAATKARHSCLFGPSFE